MSTNGIQVRVIDYTLEGVAEAEPLYRLLSTVLDEAQAPTDELAALYHERWEIGPSTCSTVRFWNRGTRTMNV